MYINKAILIGNLTKDPELKSLPSGMVVASFSIATNRTWKDKDGQKKEEVEYHNITAFGKQAELVNQYCKKGDSLYVEGRLQTRSWEADGKKLYRTEIVMETMQFGSKRNKDNSDMQDVKTLRETNGASSQDAVEYPADDINPEDIPF
jgi:single-strand DNA-binding protein